MCPQCCVLLRCDSQHPQEVVAAMQAHLRRQIQWTPLPRRLNHLKTADLYLLIINKAAGVSSPGTARYVGLNSRISAALQRLNLEECQIHFRADFSNHSVCLHLNHLLFSRTFVIAVTWGNVFFWLSFKFWQDVFYFLLQFAHSSCRFHIHMCVPDLMLPRSTRVVTQKLDQLWVSFWPALRSEFIKAYMQTVWQEVCKEKSESDLKSVKICVQSYVGCLYS